MKEDIIEIEILANGDLKATTDPISPANHLGAEKLFDFIDEVTGTKGQRHKRKDSKVHIHKHDHTRTGS